MLIKCRSAGNRVLRILHASSKLYFPSFHCQFEIVTEN